MAAKSSFVCPIVASASSAFRAAARLGGEVSFVTRVGDDANGEVLLEGLRGDGVGVDSVTVVPGGTSGTALIFVDAKGQVMIGVAEGVNRAKESTGAGVLLITHYTRILRYIEPDFVHVFVDGRIAEEGGKELADRLEAEGYDRFLTETAEA